MRERELPSAAVQSNIEAVIRLEEEGELDRTPIERISQVIGSFAGTIGFVAVQLCFVAAWVAVNLGAVPNAPVFDPFPFSLLSAVMSVESVLLTAFVLIRQNRMNRMADRRNHLDLQINLLSEKEVTKAIRMLVGISHHLGIAEETVDDEVREMGESTAVEGLARQLHDRLEECNP